MEAGGELVEDSLMVCPHCKANAKVKEQRNLFGEDILTLWCPNGCLFNSLDGGLHWFPLVTSNMEVQSENNGSSPDL